jgi:hypothetical protein
MLVVALAGVLSVTLIWATAAHAQRPVDIQHEEPKAPSGPALGPSGVSSESGEAAGSAEEPQAISSKARVLSPIGRLIVLIYGGVLAGSSLGLVLLHRSNRDR